MDICIDFDGTCVTHEFPKIGKDIGAIPVLKKLIEAGHNLILFTMRSNRLNTNSTELFLDEAVNWLSDNGIQLHGINENPSQKNWTNSPKAYAQLYIDDAALGCPLIYNPRISSRPFVDWVKVEKILRNIGVLP